jgi:hypothetical protein
LIQFYYVKFLLQRVLIQSPDTISSYLGIYPLQRVDEKLRLPPGQGGGIMMSGDLVSITTDIARHIAMASSRHVYMARGQNAFCPLQPVGVFFRRRNPP